MRWRLTVAAGIDAKDGERFVARVPEPGGAPVFAPVSLISVNDPAKAHFVEEVGVNGGGIAGGAFLKAQGAGGDKIEPEERLHRGVDFTVRQSQDMAQIERGGFGLWANGGKGKFAFQRRDDLAAAVRAKSGVVNEACGHGARDHHQIFLHIGGLPAVPWISRALAMGAEQRSFDVDRLINGFGNLSVPGGMTPGRSTGFTRRGGVSLRCRRTPDELKASLMEEPVLRAQLLDFPGLLSDLATKFDGFGH